MLESKLLLQLESPYVKDALIGLAQNTINNYYATLRQFLRFVNSKKELNKEITINDLIQEAKIEITKTEEKIDLFFDWLQSKEVKGYTQRGKTMRESSAHMRAYARAHIPNQIEDFGRHLHIKI